MRQTMERLLLGVEGALHQGAWVPRSDVRESSEGVSVTLEIPGVEREDIEIVIESNYLKVSGLREQPPIGGCVRWHQMEIAYGPFERVIALPFEPDPGRITATYREGFLRIEIGRGTEARNVPITSS
jgi:HSP20 family protein